VDDVTVPIKGTIIFKQYIPKKHTHLRIKNYKLCNSETGYIYNMRIYLGKGGQNATLTMTAIHATVRRLARREEGVKL
jgi:hypothetical protein